MSFPTKLVHSNPIIAAVRDVKHIKRAIQSPVELIFLMTGDIFTLEHCVKLAREHEKSIYLHVDLIKGVANDKEGIKFLAQKVKPDGIVSTKNHLLKTAKKEGLSTVQHLFLIDTHAFENGIKNVMGLRPDAVEIMPGLMPRIIREFRETIDCPIVTAGLIKSSEEVREAIEAGAHGVAIGEPILWTTLLGENKQR